MTNGIVPTPPSLPAGAKPTGQVVQIVSLPEGLQSNARAVRLEGEVVAQNQNGSTRIKTSEGTIDISFRGKQPQLGTKLEVDIPAGAPPRSATVRPAPPTPQTPAPVDTDSYTPTLPRVLPQQQPTQTQSPPPQTQQAGGQNTQQSQQAGTTRPQPLPPSYQAPQKPVPAQTTPQPLAQGQSVRLTSLPPVQAQAFISQSLAQLSQNAVTSTLARAAFKADVVAASASAALLKTPTDAGNITTPKHVASSIATTQTITASAPNAQSALQTISPPHLLESSLLPGALAGQKILLPLASVLRIESETNPIKNLLSSLGIFSKPDSTPSPATQQSFITSALPPPRLLQLDIKIVDVKSPQAVLSAPQPLLVGLPSPQASPSIANAAPATITGVVTGFTPQNLPILNVQWPSSALSQNLVLQFPADNVDVGTHILFQAQPSSTFAASTALKPALNIPLMEASSFWPVMDDMFQTLSQSSSPMAQMFARILPSPANPSNIGTAALLFIASVRAGDISGWLGDKRIEALTKSGKETLMKRLSQDASSIIQSNADSSSPEWRSYPIPMLWQNEISKVMLHIKHDHESENKENKDDATRFVMDLSLTRMGDVQLDGLLRGKRLDLLVRTQMPVSLSMQDAMKKAYADALTGTDIFGELGFQGDIKGWMNVLKREDKLVLSS
jgi:hypothetical protein